MSNPWSDIPHLAPFVLPCDRPFVDAFNTIADERTLIRSELLPEPFFGPLDAPVVLLLLNPGFHPDDAAVHARDDFARLLRAALASGAADHVHLAADASGPGHHWWARAVSPVVRATSRGAVARGLLAVEYFPYHSIAFAHAHIRLPSQRFSFGLVQDAMARGAEIVVGRGYDIWLGALPGLGSYSRCTRMKNPRRTSLSPGNLDDPHAFGRIVDAVRALVA